MVSLGMLSMSVTYLELFLGVRYTVLATAGIVYRSDLSFLRPL